MKTVPRPAIVKSAICRRAVTSEQSSGVKQASVVTSEIPSGRATRATSPAARAW